MQPLRLFLCGLGCVAAPLDLAAQIELPKPISGTIRVDPKGTGPDVFRDFAAALRYLSLVGIDGDLELVVAPGTYEGGLVCYPITGQKPGQRIRIRASGHGEVRLAAGSTLLRLMQGCHDLSLAGFTLGGSGGQPAVLIDDGVTDIEIRDCRFLAESGGTRVIEIQGRQTTRRIDIHHNTFALGGQHSYGIYTQATLELFVHHNDFVCDGAREPISIWNSNTSMSRVHDNVFRGSLTSTCVRLDVSGHDVDVYRNLFLLRLEGASNAVIASQGLANRAFNRIRHNVFVVLGGGIAIRTGGPLAIDNNSYAVEGDGLGQVANETFNTLPEWRESVAAVAQDEMADQHSVVANKDFFTTHKRLLDLLHHFDGDDADDGDGNDAGSGDGNDEGDAALVKATPEVLAARQHVEVRFLVDTLAAPDPVALRLAIRALCRYGRRAAPAVPALGRLCGHPHAPVRADAAAALGEIRIGAEIVIPELIKLLADQDRFVLLATTATLQGFAHLARQAQSALQGLTGHEDPAVQAAAKRALQAVSGTAGK